MQFIPLDNFKETLVRAISTSSDAFYITAPDGTATSINPPSAYGNPYYNALPFLNNSKTNYTQTYNDSLYVSAAEDKIISPSAYAPSVTIGTTTCSTSSSLTDGRWIMTITVTGDDGDEINSLYFKKKFQGNSSFDAYIFAVKLDTPVELNAENNYTANFTFSIEFD